MLPEIRDEVAGLRHELFLRARPALSQQLVEDGQPRAVIFVLIMQLLDESDRRLVLPAHHQIEETLFSSGMCAQADREGLGET